MAVVVLAAVADAVVGVVVAVVVVDVGDSVVVAYGVGVIMDANADGADADGADAADAVVVENETADVLVEVNSLWYYYWYFFSFSFSFSFRFSYPVSRLQDGYDDHGDVLRYVS